MTTTTVAVLGTDAWARAAVRVHLQAAVDAGDGEADMAVVRRTV